jgi:hypothetical protein
MNAIDVLRGLVSDRLAGLSEADLIAEFQRINGLAVDGDLGPVTERKIMEPRFCGVKDNASATRARWDHTQWDGKQWKGTPTNMLLKYHVADLIPGWSVQQTNDAFATALGSLSAVCAVEFVRLDSPQGANLLYKVGNIDGPSSTLAWCELPYGPDTPAKTLNSLIDNSEPWVNSADPSNGRLDIVRVLAHESGHGLGLEHGPDGALLAPYYNAQVRTPQAWDTQELQIRYGPHVAVTPTTPPSVPPSNPNAKAIIDIRLPNGVHYNGELEPTTV